jgi:hypothetical protein
MSEMELSVFRQRSMEATRQKARRGELHLTVAVGYVKAEDGRIEKDPDRRVQDGISLVFRKFAELQSVRQVLAGQPTFSATHSSSISIPIERRSTKLGDDSCVRPNSFQARAPSCRTKVPAS